MTESQMETAPVLIPTRGISAERANDDRVRALLAIIWAMALIPVFCTLNEPGTSPIERAAARINPNVAPWWELATLPQVGETLARELAFQQRQDATSSPFMSPRDLTRVRGIGPKTAERLTPFLHFAPSGAEKPDGLSRTGVSPEN